MLLLPIHNSYSILSKSEKIIADYIIANTSVAFSMNANELAEATGTSPATVGRFCRRLGYENYQDAKIKLISLNAGSNQVLGGRGMFVNKEDSPRDCADKLYSQITDVCSGVMENLDYNAIEQVAHRILRAEEVYFTGLGGSSVVCQDLNFKLIKLNKKTNYFVENETNLFSCMHASKGDVLLAFSFSGETREVIQAVKIAKKGGACVVAVCGVATSELARLSDFFILTPSLEQKVKIGAVSTHYSQHFVADLLFLSIAANMYEDAGYLLEETENYLKELKK